MIESDKKIEYVKNALRSSQAYDKIIDAHNFTESQKDLLLQAVENLSLLGTDNRDELLLQEAYAILASKEHIDISTIDTTLHNDTPLVVATPHKDDLKIVKRLRRIKKKQDQIDLVMIQEYLDDKTDSIEALKSIEGIERKVNTHYISSELYLMEDWDDILNKHEKLLNDILLYKERRINIRTIFYIAMGLIVLVVVYASIK